MSIGQKNSKNWRFITGVIASGRYGIGSNGRVFCTRYGKRIELRQRSDSVGYLRVRVAMHGERHSVGVHVLVALTHCGPRPSEYHEVRHLDGSKTLNHADNLAWGTRKENVADAVKHGTHNRRAPQ